MRFCVGAVVCLFLAFLGAGCRKTLAPVTDNRAPETWIVAAPQDTITSIDPATGQPIRPTIGAIPVRFHLYWAGADQDGAVNGFFYAIVETTAVSPAPPLPGPKARDYRFTTRTDSIFVFTTSEELNTRQHAFYIYAVDDKGRPDPTPARFIFRAYDSYPPEAIIEEARAEGTEYELLPGGSVRAVERTRFVTDFFEISNEHFFPRDTVAANARLYFRWTARPTIPSTIVQYYRYKLDEPDFIRAEVTDTTKEYNTRPDNQVSPGPKIFTLRAIGQSGWRGEATRWFQMNFAPDSWFAGPDANDPTAGWQTSTDGSGKRYWFKSFPGADWRVFTGVPNTQLSDDSVDVIPALRTERRTFFEMYNDRLWLHHEGDTVHLNSWVMFPAGGFDRDSPYAVKVNVPLLPPALAGKAVLSPGEPNGSPIGFRIRVPVRNTFGQLSNPSETLTYPVFDKASVYDQPRINGYLGMTSAGIAFAEIRAEDGNGTVDRRIDQRLGGAAGIVDRTVRTFTTVDDCIARGGSRADCEVRSKIIAFYVNKVPRLIRDNTFRPRTTDSLTLRPTFQLPANDVDKLDPQPPTPNRVGGTPDFPLSPILERKIAIIGKSARTGLDTCYIVPQEFNYGNNVQFDIPPGTIAPGPAIVRIRLCDCSDCDVTPWTGPCGSVINPFRESSASTGTCVDTDIPVRMGITAPAGVVGASQATQRPGSPTDSGRRQ